MSWNGTSRNQYECCFTEKAFDVFDLHAYIKDTVGRRQQALLDKFKSHRKAQYPVIITLRSLNGRKHPDLEPDGLQKQYDFFFKQNAITRNVGFYGWELGPNKGISQVPDIMRQFKEIDLK